MQKRYIALATVSMVLMATMNVKAEGKNGVAAVVNGENITVAEVKDGYDSNKQIKDKVSFKDYYGKALDVYVNGKLLYQAAVDAKITESPEYIKQLNLAKEEVARKVYLESKVGNQINDAEVKKLYGEYTKTFKGEKEVKAKHILVQNEAQAKEVIAKLKKGENFDDLAKEYSKEPAELGYFTKNMMVPEFGNAAFEMKKGQYSQTPVKTQFGYHVIQVEDIRTSKPVPMEQVKPQLEGMIAQQAIAKEFANLHKNAKVEKYGLDGKVMPDQLIQVQAPQQ